MATFTALGENFDYFCNTKVHVPGLGEIFVQRKFLAIQYVLSVFPLTHPHTDDYTHLPN